MIRSVNTTFRYLKSKKPSKSLNSRSLLNLKRSHKSNFYGLSALHKRRFYHQSNVALQFHQEENPGDELPIFELTPDNFRDAILSSSVPLLLECYVPSSEPSKEMYTKLASRVNLYKGSLRLGRLNVEEYSTLAGQLKITHIPTTFGFYKGQPIANINGLPADEQLDQFIDLLLKFGGSEEVQTILEHANQLLEEDKVDEAMQRFQELLNKPILKAEAQALSGLARCTLKKGNLEEAVELVDIIKQNYHLELGIPEVVKAISAVELALNTQNMGSTSISELEELVKNEPNNLQAKYDLANLYWSSGNREAAMNRLFELLKKDKNWNDQAARKLLLKIFETLGPDHPATVAGRRRFSNIWFA